MLCLFVFVLFGLAFSCLLVFYVVFRFGGWFVFCVVGGQVFALLVCVDWYVAVCLPCCCV